MIKSQFSIPEKDGSQTMYAIHTNGLIEQLQPKPFTYDASYAAIYDGPAYQRKSSALQQLRLAFINAMWPHEEHIHSLLDCGYGNGAFLNYLVSHSAIPSLCGSDISDVPLPEGTYFINTLDMPTAEIDVLTFWDCLEHFPQIDWLKDVQSKMICISLPHCRVDSNTEEITGNDYVCFTDWKHRKPNEHIFHFNKQSLIAVMDEAGWKCIGSGNFEDMVRRSVDSQPNILSAAFIRK